MLQVSVIVGVTFREVLDMKMWCHETKLILISNN